MCMSEVTIYYGVYILFVYTVVVISLLFVLVNDPRTLSAGVNLFLMFVIGCLKFSH